MQPNIAVRVRDALRLQQFLQPGQRAALRRAASVAVVAVIKAQGCKAVARQRPAVLGEAVHGQHQKIGGIGKRMARWLQAGMAHLAKTDLRAAVQRHAQIP